MLVPEQVIMMVYELLLIMGDDVPGRRVMLAVKMGIYESVMNSWDIDAISLLVVRLVACV